MWSGLAPAAAGARLYRRYLHITAGSQAGRRTAENDPGLQVWDQGDEPLVHPEQFDPSRLSINQDHEAATNLAPQIHDYLKLPATEF